MREQLTLLSQKYPAISDILRRQGDVSLRDYLRNCCHRSLPGILPEQDLLNEIQEYLVPFFGEQTAKKAVETIGRYRCLSTANHHHPAFEYMTVQDTILYDEWLRLQGADGNVIPFLAASNVNLTNTVYPRGMVVYDCTLPEGRLRLPLYHWKLKRPCVAALEGISPEMIRKTMDRLGQEICDGAISSSMADILENICREILLSDQVQRLKTLREQTTVINAMLSQRYFTDRVPQYVWIPLETLTARLLIKDLQKKDGFLYQILFCREIRTQMIRNLDGISGCWTSNTGGTHFFWGVDRRAILFPLWLHEGDDGLMLTGRNSLKEDVTVPFTLQALTEGLENRTLLPGLFLCFLEIYFLRDFTVFGGYYQPTYLGNMRDGIVRTLRERKIFEKEANIIEAKVNYMTLGLIYLLRDHGNGVFPVSTAELLEQPISTQEIEERLRISVEESLLLSLRR